MPYRPRPSIPSTPSESVPYVVERTPEQHDAVRRRCTPIAFAGVICGAGGLGLLVSRHVTPLTPPNVYALNLSFCAMLMGIGILYYVRGTPRVRLAIAFSLLALGTGIVGPLVFAKQSIQWHVAMEKREMDNVEAIAQGAYRYAVAHDGQYPPTIETLLDDHLVTADDLHSPFGNSEAMSQRKALTPEKFDAWYGRHSDYSYFGADLNLYRLSGAAAGTQAATSGPATAAAVAATRAGGPMPAMGALPSGVLIATSFDVIMSTQLSASFMDGHGEFLDLAKAEGALKSTNEERAKMGLPALRPPGSIQRARDAEKGVEPGP